MRRRGEPRREQLMWGRGSSSGSARCLWYTELREPGYLVRKRLEERGERTEEERREEERREERREERGERRRGERRRGGEVRGG